MNKPVYFCLSTTNTFPSWVKHNGFIPLDKLLLDGLILLAKRDNLNLELCYAKHNMRLKLHPKNDYLEEFNNWFNSVETQLIKDMRWEGSL